MSAVNVLAVMDDHAEGIALAMQGRSARWIKTAEVEAGLAEFREARATVEALIEAAEAASRYDDAIQSCANEPERMASFCTAEGDDLDFLYSDWIDKSRAALARAKGESA